MLPLSLSYDHRVIDGASAARFTTFLAQTLADARGPRGGCAVSRVDLTVPDIGNFEDILVVDVLVKKGDTVEVDAPLVTLETDKASMDVALLPQQAPSPRCCSKLATRLSKGTVIARGSKAAPPQVLARMLAVAGAAGDASMSVAAGGVSAQDDDEGEFSAAFDAEELEKTVTQPRADAGAGQCRQGQTGHRRLRGR